MSTAHSELAAAWTNKYIEETETLEHAYRAWSLFDTAFLVEHTAAAERARQFAAYWRGQS